MKIDNTALVTFQSCPAKFNLRHREHWTPRKESGALGYGKIVHKGLETWYAGIAEGKSRETRLAEARQIIIDLWPENHPTDNFRTMQRAVELIEKYVKEYPEETWQPLMIEVPFKFEMGRWLLRCPSCRIMNRPWAEDGPVARCEGCGCELEPIEYGGVFDMLVEYPGNRPTLYVLDHKTTSQLGGLFFHQFMISNQITGYVWGAQQASGKKLGGAIVNALCTTVSGKISFKRQITIRSEADIEAWKDDVAATCNMIREAELNSHWPKFTEQCMGKYGLCPYHDVHVLSDPDEQLRRLETDYIRREWDFELRDATVAE